MPLNNKKSFFSTLMSGDFGLSKTYWLYTFLPAFVMQIAMKPLEKAPLVVFGITLLYLGYAIPAIIGVWRASNKYQGRKAWVILAKIVIVIQWISIAFLAYMAINIVVYLLGRI